MQSYEPSSGWSAFAFILNIIDVKQFQKRWLQHYIDKLCIWQNVRHDIYHFIPLVLVGMIIKVKVNWSKNNIINELINFVIFLSLRNNTCIMWDILYCMWPWKDDVAFCRRLWFRASRTWIRTCCPPWTPCSASRTRTGLYRSSSTPGMCCSLAPDRINLCLNEVWEVREPRCTFICCDLSKEAYRTMF